MKDRIIFANKELHFRDFFDLKELQAIQDAFSEISGVSSIITDVDGNSITMPSNLCPLCEVIRSTPGGLANCLESSRTLAKQVLAAPTVRNCLSAGILEGGVHIVVEGNHLANWLIGQVLDINASEEQLLDYAKNLGIDEGVFVTALQKTPRMSKEKFNKICQGLCLIVEQLTQLAIQNHNQAKNIAELDQVKMTLQQNNEELEALNQQLIATQDSLKESEIKFRQLAENIKEVFWLRNEEKLLYISPAFEEVWGYSTDILEPNPMRWLETIHPDDRERMTRYYNGIMQLKEPQDQDYRIIRGDGSIRWIRGRTFPVYSCDGEVIRVAGIAKDITDKKEAEEERLLAVKRANMTERLASLGSMVAGVAHEINQPLQAMKVTVDGMLYWRKRGKLLEEKLPTNLERISAQVNRIDHVVKRMRSFISRGGNINIGLVDLNQAVCSALDLISYQLTSHGIDVEKNLAEKLPPVLGDQVRLEELIINLLINAMQALDNTNQPYKRISISTLYEKNSIVMQITDNGTGLEQAVRDKIFEPFYTTKKPGEGMGLGLSIVHNTVVSCGGKIQVWNNQCRGATFRIEIPIAE